MTVNPRGRNMLQEAAHASGRITHSLPPPQTPFERAIKQLLDTRTSGDPVFDRWATVRDLQELGLRGTEATESVMPRDLRALPVWVSRGKFVPVSLSALATSLRDLLATDSASAADLAALKRRVNELQPGLRQSQVQLLIDRAVQELLRDVQRRESAASQDLERRLNGVERTANDAMALARRRGPSPVEITVAATSWPITHTLNRYPLVTTLNAAGEVVHGDVSYPSLTEITITHGRAMTGWVLLS